MWRVRIVMIGFHHVKVNEVRDGGRVKKTWWN